MTLIYQSAVRRALTLIEASDQVPRLVGIDGPGGSGKSTFACELASALTSPSVVIQGDDFYRDLDNIERLKFTPRQGYSYYFDWQRLLKQVLIPAHSRQEGLRYQRYEWNSQVMGEWVDVTPLPTVVIIEGIYTLRPELRSFIDLKIYLKAEKAVRLERQIERGENSNEWVYRWMAAEDYYVSTFAPEFVADLVVNGN